MSKIRKNKIIDGLRYVMFVLATFWIVIGTIKGLGYSFSGALIAYNRLSSLSCFIRALMAMMLSRFCYGDHIKYAIEKLLYDRNEEEDK